MGTRQFRKLPVFIGCIHLLNSSRGILGLSHGIFGLIARFLGDFSHGMLGLMISQISQIFCAESNGFSALRALPLIRASASLKNGTQDFSIFNFQFIKVPSTPCSDASFASFQRLLLYSARHQHASFQASRQTTAGIPTNGSGHPDERQQVFPTPLPHRTKAARCALQRCSP